MFQNIKPISEKSYKVFSYLADAARNSKSHAIKIKNSETYTPVTVEIIFFTSEYEHVSICHYGEMNGDLMADPEMVFFHDKKENVAYPGYYLNHYAGIEQTSLQYDDYGKPVGVRRVMQRGQADFANMWMKNIDEQQALALIR